MFYPYPNMLRRYTNKVGCRGGRVFYHTFDRHLLILGQMLRTSTGICYVYPVESYGIYCTQIQLHVPNAPAAE